MSELAVRVTPPLPEVPAATLPLWPLWLMFGLVPLWWLVGGFYLIWPVFGALLLALLAARGQVRVPTGTGWWLAFLSLVLLSAIGLTRGTQVLTFALRLVFYCTALVTCVYVYNLVRERRVGAAGAYGPLVAFWLALIALGWLGVVAPRLSLATPVELVLPDSVVGAKYAKDMVHLHAAEFNPRSATPTYRPSAPYPYTNNWGSTYAVLVPCVVASLLSAPGRRLRLVLLASLPLSLPPAFLTLNRGMFLSLGAGLAFLAARAVRRGNARVAVSVVGLVLLGWLASLVIPVGELIARRLSVSASTADRADLYLRTLASVRHSPLLGYGAPALVDTTTASVPVGTQGQLWLVLFSHGVPALLCLVGWFLVVFVRGLRDASPAGQWLNLVPLVALAQLPIYGLTYHNLTVVFFAAGLSLAMVDRR